MANQQPSQEQMQEAARQNAQLMAKVWSDDQFKQRLINDPRAVLQEQGIDAPRGVEVRVVENTANIVYLVLPPQPSEEISDEQLEQVAGGNTLGSAGSVSSVGSVGTLFSCLLTMGSVGSAGTAGSAQPR